MTQISQQQANWIFAIWFGSPLLCFFVAFLLERWLCKKEKKGMIHVLPVVAGLACSFLSLYIASLSSTEVQLYVLCSVIVASILGSLVAHLIYGKIKK